MEPKRKVMGRLTPEKIEEGFRLLGLETENARSELKRFSELPSDQTYEITRIDFSTRHREDIENAKLA
jgi:hypothetical protein